jgi:hypothetical protein
MDVISLLHDSDPARGHQVPGPDSFLGQRIGRDILSSGAAEQAPRRSRPQSKMARSFPVATALVFAVAIVLLITLLSGPGVGSKPVRNPEVLKALDSIASTAAKQPSVPAGRYYYTEIEDVNTTSSAPTFSAYTLGIDQSWISPNGSGLQTISQELAPHFATAADREAWIKAGRPPVATPPFRTVQTYAASTSAAAGEPPLYDVSGLPVDPDRLYAILNREDPVGSVAFGKLPKGIAALDYQGSCDSAACSLFERTAALLQGPEVGMTPAFRSALFKVLAMVPGIQFLGTIDDPIGQTGTGFRFSDSSPGQTYYVSCKYLRMDTKPFPGSKPYWYAAFSNLYTIVINPRTSALMSQEQSYLPLVRRPSPVQSCPSRIPLPKGVKVFKEKPQELLPIFDVVLRSAVVDSLPKATTKS